MGPFPGYLGINFFSFTLIAQQSHNQVPACSREQEVGVTRHGGGGREWKMGPEGRGGGLEVGLPEGLGHGGPAE